LSNVEPHTNPEARRDEVAHDNRPAAPENRPAASGDRGHESLATRGAYGGPPPNMRDMQRMDMLGGALAVLITLGPLFLGVITA
jgi:hypothetical protein